MVSSGSGLILLVSGAIFACVSLLVVALTWRRPSIGERVASFSTGSAATPRGSPEATGPSSGPRVLRPIAGGLIDLLARTAPSNVRKDSEVLLMAAGRPIGLTTLLGIRGLTLVGLPLLAYLMLRTQSPLMMVGGVALAALLGGRLPGIWLKRLGKRRVEAIDLALPNFLDLLVICTEGGLSLEAGIARVSDNIRGPLADELGRVRQDISVGLLRREALRQMGDRAGSPMLRTFALSVIQAEQMGVGIGQALRTLADEIRTRRRQKAEEKAREVPVKMLPVLILFILPSLFIVVLTPAVVSIMQYFSSQGP